MTVYIQSDINIDPSASVGSYARWWDVDASIHLDYENDRAFINGIAYSSIAAARTAGALVAISGKDTVAVTSPAASFSLVGTGVTRNPSSTRSAYLTSLDDGADGAVDHLAGLVEQTYSSVPYVGAVVFVGGSPQLTAGPSSLTHKSITSPQAVRMGLRVKLNSTIISVNGLTLSTDTSCLVPTITRLTVGGIEGAARPWGGTVKQIVFINKEITEARLNSVLA